MTAITGIGKVGKVELKTKQDLTRNVINGNGKTAPVAVLVILVLQWVLQTNFLPNKTCYPNQCQLA
jgi:hypothetical protein